VFPGDIALTPVNSQSRRWARVLSRLAVRYFWRCFAAVLALMSWNAFWRLGSTFVRDHDEGRYGVAASEMLHAHSLLVTTYAGATEFWNLKPPLGYWLLDLSYWSLGETPFALRVPAATCALAATALTMLWARRMARASVGLLAGIVLATSFGFLGHHAARSGDLDAPLTLILLLFLMLAPRMMDVRAARLAAGLVLSLGFLLKSFAILPCVMAVATYGLITRGVASWRVWPLPLGITAVTAATWAMARSAAEGSWEFVRRMFVEDLLLRSTTMIDAGRSSNWDYAGALFDRLAPWPIVVLLALAVSRRFASRRMSSDFAILMGCYAFIPPVLFTLARTHHSWYIIPSYPAWAILAAAAIMEVLQQAERVKFAAAATAMVAVCALACEVRVMAQVEIYDQMTQSQVFLASLRNQAAGGGQVLRTTFTPSYSERFLLQVVDGFKLDELGAVDLSPVQSRLADETVLIRKAGAGSMSTPSELPGVTILAQDGDYALVHLSPRAMAGTIE
jgi:4-amino-4-deoxy-L-arabinose transferase-like glycosyltransferase